MSVVQRAVDYCAYPAASFEATLLRELAVPGLT